MTGINACVIYHSALIFSCSFFLSLLSHFLKSICSLLFLPVSLFLVFSLILLNPLFLSHHTSLKWLASLHRAETHRLQCKMHFPRGNNNNLMGLIVERGQTRCQAIWVSANISLSGPSCCLRNSCPSRGHILVLS